MCGPTYVTTSQIRVLVACLRSPLAAQMVKHNGKYADLVPMHADFAGQDFHYYFQNRGNQSTCLQACCEPTFNLR
jgi:hypothetical protein